MLNELKGKGLLIHHWDTDGICSAKLILEHLKNKNIENHTPELGNYFLTEKEIEKYSNYDFIIIIDMSLPEENIKRLAKNAKIMIFDHHLGKEIKQIFHYNPIIKGENPDEYPSASWIVNTYLNNKINLFALLGIVGDHENKIQKNKAFSKILSDFCIKNNIKFDDMLNMVYLLDSNYKIGDKKAVEEAPHQIKNQSNGLDILQNKKWKKNLDLLNKEINKQIKTNLEEKNRIIIKKMHTSYNIISTVTRKISWDSGKNTLVVNTGFFKDMDQIYVRSNKDLTPMIQKWKNMGLKAGGKKEVLGAVVSKNKTDTYIKEILEFLKE